jgi:hypothetical protein
MLHEKADAFEALDHILDSLHEWLSSYTKASCHNSY